MPRQIIDFYQGWKFQPDFRESYLNTAYNDSKWESVNIPHTNKIFPATYFDEKEYQFVSCYRKKLDIPQEFIGKRIFLDFDGVMAYAEVYLNGKIMGFHKGGYTPFTIDLTDGIDFENPNILAVMVDSTERADIPPFGNVVDYLTFGGIYRGVRLRVTDPVFIQNAMVKTENVLLKKPSVRCGVKIRNTVNKLVKAEINVSLMDAGKCIGKSKSDLILEPGETLAEVYMDQIGQIELWDIDNPRLYQVKLELNCGGAFQDEWPGKTGFREAKFTADGFYLNGKILKIRGLNRHQTYPYIGGAMPARVQRRDADILKYELGVNTVRTSHYPQSPDFLDRCDEIGLLVLEEIPGWQHIGDEEWKKVALENTREMIERDRNHPSVISWGVRINESKDDHEFYRKTNELAHSLDTTRQTFGVRNFDKSELLEDVYTYNDFSYDGGEVILREQKSITGVSNEVPYLVTEFSGHIFPAKRFDQVERQIEHSLRHLKVQNTAILNEDVAGAVGWCAFDYHTHSDFGSGDRICYHGVMDIFRLPKFAAYFYASQVKPEEKVVLEPAVVWANGERNKCGMAPIVIYTNCDSVEFFYGEKRMGLYYPDRKSYQGIERPPVVIDNIEGYWGVRFQDARFVGYLDGKAAAERRFVKDPVPSELRLIPDDDCLEADGRDATRVVLKILDQAGNILPFFFGSAKIKVEGQGELIGPSDLALSGGSSAIWIRSKEGEGKIRISAAYGTIVSNTCQITTNYGQKAKK